MQNNQPLPAGFIPLEEAIALIKADKRDDATVDLQFLVNNVPFLKKKGTYNIRLLKTVKDEATGQNKTVRNGTVYVFLPTEYDVQVLYRAIKEAYEERTKIALADDVEEALGVNRLTTAIDEEKGMGERVRVNTESRTKKGADISKSYEQVLQGV